MASPRYKRNVESYATAKLPFLKSMWIHICGLWKEVALVHVILNHEMTIYQYISQYKANILGFM